MAQSALTVTPPNPTPPTNFPCTGGTPPTNVPNFTKNTMNDPKNWSSVNPKDFPPPYFDDGAAGPLTTFAANTAALASGSATTAGGTEGTYPGTGTGTTVNNVGAVPASSSVAHEGAGTETLVSAPGSRAECPTASVSSGPVQTAATLAAGPNASHASTLSGTAVPTLTGASGASNVSGAGYTLLTATGTNFNRASVVNINGVPYQTNYVSATSLTVTNAPKKATAGTVPVTVTSNGVTTAPQNWTFT
jgi:hypothetical protein